MAQFFSVDAKVRYSPAGIAAAAWADVTDIQNVTVSIAGVEANVSSWGSEWEKVGKAMLRGTFDIEVLYDSAATSFIAFRAAALSRTAVTGLELLDKATGQGLQVDVAVMDMTIGRNLEGHQTARFTCKPTRSATEPSWITPA